MLVRSEVPGIGKHAAWPKPNERQKKITATYQGRFKAQKHVFKKRSPQRLRVIDQLRSDFPELLTKE